MPLQAPIPRSPTPSPDSSDPWLLTPDSWLLSFRPRTSDARLAFGAPTLAPLGESDLWTPMGSIGPQKSGRVLRKRRGG
jgi:hypothetical protein